MALFHTRVVVIDPVAPEASLIAEAAAVIRAGQLVAFPTETVYGLGADGLNPTAMSQIYTVKGRPPDNPLILHLASQDQLPVVAATVPAIAHILMQAFWPGPLTLVLPKTALVPDLATAGLTTVAVRMPSHPIALALIQASDTPLAAPSANRSGRPSPTTAQHVFDDMNGSIPLILDGGPTAIGVESTVLDVTCSPPLLLRPGGIPREALEALIGPLQKTTDASLHRRSPGTRYRHYSPQARVFILDEVSTEALQGAVAATIRCHTRVGCLLHRLELEEVPSGVIVRRIGGSLEDYARALFAGLRQFDTLGVEAIIVEGVAEVGLGVAVMDRLRRAAWRPCP
jgi:L-threonylcarbamoyladenylate synthase